MQKQAGVTITKDALILRIPWTEVAAAIHLKKGRHKLTADEVLAFVQEGRRSHKSGKTRLIQSLAELA